MIAPLPSPLDQGDSSALWLAFSQISSIPRESKHEAEIITYLQSQAQALGLPWEKDGVGNLVVRKKAQKCTGPMVTLQAHVDMVCEKNKGTVHDFLQDPILWKLEGDWLWAQGTTLGADNGIGVAMMLDLLRDNHSPHPPLECLFTIDEESALVGASELDPSMVQGRLLINLDSEDEGHFTIGCAGGVNIQGQKSFSLHNGTPDDSSPLWDLSLTGLPGGHSGVEIQDNRGNSIKSLGDLLLQWIKEDPELCLVSMEGGNKHNAIPREAFVTLRSSLPLPQIQALLYEAQKKDPRINFLLEPRSSQSQPSLSHEESLGLLQMIDDLPQGVQAYSEVNRDFVQTSNNLASVVLQEGRLKVLLSIRSSEPEDQKALVSKIQNILQKGGLETQVSDGYPPWPPAKENPLLDLAVETYRNFYKKDPVVEIIHAGLECGIIGSKVEGMKMISLGPDIQGAHTPQERVSISSTNRVYAFLKTFLARGKELPQ